MALKRAVKSLQGIKSLFLGFSNHPSTANGLLIGFA
jgi:hypothetical protein